MYIYGTMVLNSDKTIYRENLKHILYLITFFFSENCDVCGKMWKNMVVPDRPRPQYNKAYGL
jgi:hypothetical protein